MKKVIYALFDDGNQSVKKALEPLGYEVYSFGIQEKETVIKCDLTDIADFFYKTQTLPEPDFIFSNPPCETFSNASSATYEKGGVGNMYYYIDGTPVTNFDDWKTTTSSNIKRMKRDKKEYFKELQVKRLISEKLHENTDAIIKYYGVPAVIENPRTSYCWKLFHKEDVGFKKAHTNYNNYDESFTKKPTTFANNFGLKLNQENKKAKATTEKDVRNYNKRSAVPEALIKEIVKQMELNS